MYIYILYIVRSCSAAVSTIMLKVRIMISVLYECLLYLAWADQRRRLFCIDHTVQNIKGQYCMLI